MPHEHTENLIFEEHKDFTISVVTREFAVKRGFSFFKHYENSPNFIANYDDRDFLLKKILKNIAKKIPPLAGLIEACFGDRCLIGVDLTDALDALFMLFSAHEHQAAGPEVTDPIIIQEDQFTERDIAEIVNLHKQTLLRPRVVIILKDNDFERAKTILRFCHNGLRVRLIANRGVVEICKVINTGADNVEQFLDIYSRQCFDACSRTKANVIVNEEWAEDSFIKKHAPNLLRFRTNVIYDKKTKILPDLSGFIDELKKQKSKRELVLGFECIALLFRVYCLDQGGEDILRAQVIAEDLQNDILKAHVYRYAHFLPNISREEKVICLQKAQNIFNEKGMADHSVYCENNRLTNFFYEDHVSQAEFDEMLDRAQSDVPGLVGMSTLWNNVGVSHLYNSKNSEAVECFQRGLSYYPDHTKQLGLMSNLLVAKFRAGEMLTEHEVRNAIEHCMMYFGSGRFAFLGANNLINILKASNIELAKDLTEQHSIKQTIIDGLTGQLGTSSLAVQVRANDSFFKKIGVNIEAVNPKSISTTGIRNKYAETTGFNPAIYNVWF